LFPAIGLDDDKDMAATASWHEVESEVYPAGNWVLVALGAMFLLVGGIGFFVGWNGQPRGTSLWVVSAVTAFCASIGAILFLKSVRAEFRRRRVRHAAPDVLPDVPRERLAVDRPAVAVRLMLELVEDSDGWQLRPSEQLRQNDRLSLIRFGIPLLIVVGCCLSWAIHDHGIAGGWPAAILSGTVVTIFCGGSVLIGTLLANRSQFGELCRLTIPNHGGDLELVLPPRPSTNAGQTTTGPLPISRQKLLAVQLCPWKFCRSDDYERSTTWAVQGLLVLDGSETAPYLRFPILLTSDLPNAACLMQQLAEILRVPYLFGGDAAGWRLEEQLARHRAPLRVGGSSQQPRPVRPPLKTPS
jgi:hypothetical protein